MIIALTGAHSVGKTTLGEKLQEYLPEYKFREEPYYELEQLGYVFSEMPIVDDFIEQLEYSTKQIKDCKDNIIFDRCPIDFIAYIQALDRSRNILSEYDLDDIVSKIDLLVFVSIEQPDLIKCNKSNFPELRYQVNELLNDVIADLNIETLEVKGSVMNRKDQILSKINDMYKRQKR